MISRWILDEQRDAARPAQDTWEIDRTHVAFFNYEFDTSADPPRQACALVGYGRNVVVLRNCVTNVSETDG